MLQGIDRFFSVFSHTKPQETPRASGKTVPAAATTPRIMLDMGHFL
jgi:hypothetical protein